MSELVSVVMATYNGEKYIDQQIESILQQTYKNFELVVVDDASTDNTIFHLQAFAAKDQRVKIYRNSCNLGVVKTFERGLNLSIGKFIALSDQDDIFAVQKLEKQVKALKSAPRCDLVVSDLRLIRSDDSEISSSMWCYQELKVKSGKPFCQLLYANFATGCATMFTRRLLAKALPFPPDCFIHDWWLSVAAASSWGGGIVLIPEPLTSYRQHASNVIGAHSKSIRAGLKRVPPLKKRMIWYAECKARIEGYRTKKFWTAKELSDLKNAENVFCGFLADGSSSFINRILRLPSRLHLAREESMVHLCGISLLTIFPQFVENILGRNE